MDRVAVFVDAGYVFAQGSVELCGKKLPRGHMTLNYAAAVNALEQFATQASGLPLLRIYWYDGTSQGPTTQHIALAYQPGVKVRLGFVNSVGQQKGVDSLIVTDMITLAQNRAMAECVLLSGDEDIRVGVQQAQAYGVRVHLLGIRPARGSQSQFLLQEADSTHEWGAADLHAFLECDVPETLEVSAPAVDEAMPEPAQGTQPPVSSVSGLAEVATLLASEIPAGEVQTLLDNIRATGQRPREIDGKLLARSRAALGDDLGPGQKMEVRAAFTAALEARVSPAAAIEPPKS